MVAPGFDQHCLGAALRVSFYGRRLAGFDRGGHQQPMLGSETVALGASRGDLGQAIVQAPEAGGDGFAVGLCRGDLRTQIRQQCCGWVV